MSGDTNPISEEESRRLKNRIFIELCISGEITDERRTTNRTETRHRKL